MTAEEFYFTELNDPNHLCYDENTNHILTTMEKFAFKSNIELLDQILLMKLPEKVFKELLETKEILEKRI